jgi:uncharacterized protein YcbX
MSMKVVALRRYPVKSMGGEALAAVGLDARGLEGDRWYAVVDAEGRLASGKSTRRFRRRDQVFDYAAATTAAGAVVVSRGERRWNAGDPGLDAELTHAMGATVRVAPEERVSHQDAASVSLVGTASLDWCAARWGGSPDPRRLRVNIVFASDEPFVEETWAGRELTLGAATLRVLERVERCRTIDIDQDGAAAADGRWLKLLSQEREMCLAVYADVAAPGVVRVGDELAVR